MRRISALPLGIALLCALAGPLHAQAVSTFASVAQPRGVAVDAFGNLYVSQRYTYSKIVKFALPSNAPINFSTSGFVDPIDMVFDDSGNLFVADYDNGGAFGKIVKITPGGVASDFVHLPNPGALTRDAAGNLYAGLYFDQKVMRITSTGDTSTYAKSIGPAGARLAMMHMDTDGTLYAGILGGDIYKIGPGGSPITPWVSGLHALVGFTPSASGWWATTYTYGTVVQITPAGVASLYAGTPAVLGFVNGPLLSAQFYYPAGIVQIFDTVYIADNGNSAVRSIALVPSSTQSSSWGRLKALYR